jgi:hypothetical protein
VAEPAALTVPDAAAAYLDAARQAGAECLEAAVGYLARGWSALAVCPPDHAGVGKTHAQHCKQPGKAPWGAWKKFQTDLPTEDELRRKWQSNPLLNVGAVMGRVSGLVAPDEDGPAGAESLAKLSGGDVPPTLTFTSGREEGGRRRLYAIPPGVELRVTHPHGDEIASGLSLLGEGSQTVMPPSRHKTGRRYAWVPGLGPGEIEPAPAPAWLVARMVRDRRHAGGGHAGNGPAPPVGERVEELTRNVTLCSLAGSMRRRGMDFNEVLAALLVVNEQRCRPPLDQEEVEAIARNVSGYEPEDSAFTGKPGSPLRGGLDLALVEAIRQDFVSRYRPAFKQGTAIWSQREERFVKPSEATYAPGVALLGTLAGTSGAPKDKKGEVDVDRLVRQFWTLAPVAWRGMLDDGLPEEQGQSDGCSASAEERFRRQVAGCLFAQATFTNKNHQTGEREPERYTLLQWCRLWAKPGAWQPVRAALLWCRLDEAGRLRIALRSELFGQYGPKELADMPHKQFARLAEMYTVGLGGDDVRPGGKRAVELTVGFISELEEGPGQHAD